MYDDWPVAAAFAFLTAVAFLRAGGTYALGRGARHLGDRGDVDTRRARLLAQPSVRRAEALVRRFGAPAVTLCFLTVGVQTAVNAAAGALRMPLVKYIPALILGALIWATIYVTVGLAVISAFWRGDGRWLLGAAALVLVVVGVTVLVRSRLARRP